MEGNEGYQKAKNFVKTLMPQKSKFVKKYINKFNFKDLNELNQLLYIDDSTLFRWYLKKKIKTKIPINKVSNLLKKFKL